MKKTSTRTITFCAIFAALTAVLSQISIPIGLVPINLATLSVYLTGGILGMKRGSLSQFCYVLIGAVGCPVFASFKGGLPALLGPTGGFLIGYIAAAWLIGLLCDKYGVQIGFLILFLIAGTAVCYLFGTIWFLILFPQKGLVTALSACVIPFLPGDAAKIILACILIPKLRPMAQRAFAA